MNNGPLWIESSMAYKQGYKHHWSFVRGDTPVNRLRTCEDEETTNRDE
jgi:hypothetical protein